MIRIGVLVAYNSLEEIKPIEQLLKTQCELTFFTYKKLVEIKQIYTETQFLFDGIVMNHLAYLSLEKEVIEFKTPTFSYMPSESDFFKTMFKVSTTYRDLDFSRVCFDYIGYSDLFFELEDVFVEGQFPYIIEGHISDQMYEELLQKHLELSKAGKIDLSITSFSSILNELTKLGIRAVHLNATLKTILETFEIVIKEIEYRRLTENRIVIGHITSDSFEPSNDGLNDLELNQMLLHTSLLSFSKGNNVPLIIQRNNLSFEIITSYKDLKLLTNQFKSDLVLEYLKEQLQFNINIGWGIGKTLYEARKKAQNANNNADTDSYQSIIITEDDQIIEPLEGRSLLKYSNSVSPELHELSERLDISSLQLQKILSVISNTNSNELSSEDISFHLGITIRSANRMLNKLEDKGVASAIYKKQEKLRGRPKKIYKINFQKALDN
ncbi:transcriptional regulator [Peribacillus sp. NPDC096540]|uniref:transcriptional regulator n=1 Tax=Peribacillus sp. NPDC096540 TaxID=3390612 RepID=UPI003D008845